MKKYRLKINYSEITEENFEVAQRLREGNADGDILMEGSVTSNSGLTHSYKVPDDIPKSWLTEIKEPLSFEEWNKEEYPLQAHPSARLLENKKIWNAAIENYKLSQDVDEEPEKINDPSWDAVLEAYEHVKLPDGEINEVAQSDGFMFHKLYNGLNVSPRDGSVKIHINDIFNIWKAALKYARGEK